MKERPILFSAPMVRAILDGCKTQTRRVIIPDPKLVHCLVVNFDEPAYVESARLFRNREANAQGQIACPFGTVGDRLWVRETHSVSHGSSSFGGDYHSSCEVTYRAGGFKRLAYDGPHSADPYQKAFERQRGDWRPSIFMPRWASRITLELTAVRVERVQQITMGDAVAEGILGDNYMARDNYRELWNSLNAKRGFEWDSNPWVWVIEFRRIEA